MAHSYLKKSNRVAYWNCCSGLVRKWDFINDYIIENDIDIFFVAEAELPSNRDHSLFSVPGYTLEVANTLTTRGRARLISLRKEVYQRVNDLECDFNDIICLRAGNQFCVGVYRPFKCFSGETLTSNFERFIENLYLIGGSLQNGERVTIIGDMNINLDDQSQWSNRLISWSDDFVLDQLVHEITRSRMVANKLQTSTLDLVFTNLIELKVRIEFNDMSDHAILMTEQPEANELKHYKSKVNTLDWRRYSKSSIIKLFSSNFPGINKKYKTSDSINDLISNAILRSLNSLVPKVSITIRGNNSVSNPKICNLKNTKHRISKLWSKTRSSVYWLRLKDCSRALKREINKERRRILHAGINGSNQKFWNTTNRLIGRNIQNRIEIVRDGTVIDGDESLAELFVEAFTNKIEFLQSQTSYTDTTPNFSIEDTPNFSISPEMVERMIGDLRSGKMQGFDEIPSKVVKDLSKQLCVPLAWLFNTIIHTGVIPKAWKIATITPIHKKGDRKDLNNYRPVNNTSTLSKVFEKCILENLLLTYGTDKLFGKNQHGYCKGRSTVTAALSLQDFIACKMDKGDAVMLYSADLSSAFDLLRPGKLIEIMSEMGIDLSLQRVIYNFLSNRSALVQINGSSSTLRHIPVGCVQGSILGPALFNIYTSQLTSKINADFIVSYADDTYVAVSVPKSKIFNGLWKINLICETHFNWLASLGMVYNSKKTEFIIFGKKLRLPQYTQLMVKDTFVDNAQSITVLGIKFTSDLSSKSHALENIKSANSQLFALRYLNSKLSRNQFKQIIHAHYLNRLLYASALLAGTLMER